MNQQPENKSENGLVQTKRHAAYNKREQKVGSIMPRKTFKSVEVETTISWRENGVSKIGRILPTERRVSDT